METLGLGRLLYTTKNKTSMLFLPCAIYIVRNLVFYCSLSNTDKQRQGGGELLT